MAIAQIITRGFGPGATIPLVVTAGYSIGVASSLPDSLDASTENTLNVRTTESVFNDRTTEEV